jgi:hypothetical protein
VGWQPGREKLWPALNDSPAILVTEDEYVYFHALYYGPEWSRLFLLCNDAAVRTRWSQYSSAVATLSEGELSEHNHMRWLAPTARRSAESLTKWAQQRGFALMRRSVSEMTADEQMIGWRVYYELIRRE